MSLFLQNPLIVIIGFLIISFTVCQQIPESRINLIRLLCLDCSLIALVLGTLSCLAFNQSMIGFQFLFRINIFSMNNLTFTVGADGLSMIFLLLTLLIFPICFASS